jgi:hypothetical protein
MATIDWVQLNWARWDPLATLRESPSSFGNDPEGSVELN